MYEWFIAGLLFPIWVLAFSAGLACTMAVVYAIGTLLGKVADSVWGGFR